MKKLPVILLAAAAPLAAAMAQSWTGAVSTQWDLTNNWSPNALPSGNTITAQIEWGFTAPGAGGPVIDSSINTAWGLGRIRGYGLKIAQTGGTHEWQNGSGRVTKGMAVYSRPVAFTPQSFEPTNAAIAKLTGGTMITDTLGLGTTASTTYYTDPPQGGGDYAEDTGVYVNWQTTVGDSRNGWGRLHIQGDATFIVRPNRFVYPTGYAETNAYWTYDGTAGIDYFCRIFDIAIATNSQMRISDNGKLVAPHKIYTNAIIPEYNDRDLLTQLQYYAGLIEAGSPPHYVQNGALSGPRLAAGPGQTLQFDLFPAGTNEVNEPYGGYFTVTAVPAPFVQLNLLSAGSLAVGGLVGREYQIESTDDLNSGWAVRTNFALAVSPQTWNDPAPSSANRFYRAALLPLP